MGLINVPYIEYARIEWMDILCVHLDEMKDWMKIQLSLFLLILHVIWHADDIAEVHHILDTRQMD